MLTLENPPPTLETCGDLNGIDYRKNYSKSFQKMVEKCLQRDPEKRYVVDIICMLHKSKEFDSHTPSQTGLNLGVQWF